MVPRDRECHHSASTRTKFRVEPMALVKYVGCVAGPQIHMREETNPGRTGFKSQPQRTIKGLVDQTGRSSAWQRFIVARMREASGSNPDESKKIGDLNSRVQTRGIEKRFLRAKTLSCFEHPDESKK